MDNQSASMDETPKMTSEQYWAWRWSEPVEFHPIDIDAHLKRIANSVNDSKPISDSAEDAKPANSAEDTKLAEPAEYSGYATKQG